MNIDYAVSEFREGWSLRRGLRAVEEGRPALYAGWVAADLFARTGERDLVGRPAWSPEVLEREVDAFRVRMRDLDRWAEREAARWLDELKASDF